ncbi:MAG: hypothetical protein ISS26_00460 [Candidatus Omnitrophica bacterium]|nr:hypothetical protein [Candidatus Omnitrophota bacterium]
MKRSIAIVMLVLFIASLMMPAYADEAQSKRAENHRKIADFVADTAKLPWVILGILGGRKPEKIKEDLKHKGNTGLTDAIRKNEGPK